MKYILGLILLISSSVYANTGSGNTSNVIGVAGGNVQGTYPPAAYIPDGSIGEYKTLLASVRNATTLTYVSFFDMSVSTATAYIVPANTSFKVLRTCWANFANAPHFFALGASTGTIAVQGAATDPTGAYYIGASAKPDATPAGAFALAAAGGAGGLTALNCLDIPYSFPAGYRPFEFTMDTGGQFAIYLVGKEVPGQ